MPRSLQRVGNSEIQGLETNNNILTAKHYLIFKFTLMK